MGHPIEAFLLSQTEIWVIEKGKTTENIVFLLPLWVENVCTLVEYGGAYRMCVCLERKMVTANQRTVSKQSPHKISTHTRLKYLALLRKWNNS